MATKDNKLKHQLVYMSAVKYIDNLRRNMKEKFIASIVPLAYLIFHNFYVEDMVMLVIVLYNTVQCGQEDNRDIV